MNDNLSSQNFMTSLRYLITALGSFAVGKGWITNDTINAVLGVVAIIGPLAWGMYTNWKKQQDAKQSVTAAVRAGVAEASDPTSYTPPPAAISPSIAQTIIDKHSAVVAS